MGYYDDCLEHHGIKGQKWGVRRFENKGGHLTAAGKKRYDTDEDGNYKKLNSSSKSAGTSSGEEKKKGLTDEQKAKLKKAAIIGGAAVGTALAAYGGYKLYQLNKEATQGLKSRDYKDAVSKFKSSHEYKMKANMGGDNSGKYYEKAMDLREAGQALERKVKSSDYSVKEKVDYLKDKKSGKLSTEQLKAMGIQTFEPDRIQLDKARIDRVSADVDSYTRDLLKKNGGILGSYTMNDLKKLDLY